MPDANNPAEQPANNRPNRKPRKPRVPAIPAPAVSASIADAIIDAATGPKSATVDGQTAQAHDLRQLIEADRYLASRRAARRPRPRFDKMAPPGAG